MQLIVITGLSGAGKGLAARHFEDFGYFCVDNLPPALIPSFAELLQRGQIGKAALVVDARGGDFPELLAFLDGLAQSELEARILFLDCDDDALLKRFKETRRKHPLDDGISGLADAILREREALVPLRARADKVVNTSHVTPRELREEIKKTFVDAEQASGMLIQVESFGFKHGPPTGADMVFDVRFLPNPNYDREIGHLDGFCQPVIDYVMREPVTGEFLAKWEDFITFLVPQFEREGKAYLTIAVGCTGGRHRSVALSNWLAERLQNSGFRANATHRDLIRHAPTPPVSEVAAPSQMPQSQTFGASDGLQTERSAEVADANQNGTNENGIGGNSAVQNGASGDHGGASNGPTFPASAQRGEEKA